MEKWISRFHEYLTEKKQVADNTARAYVQDVLQFADFLDGNILKTNASDADAYIRHLVSRGRAASTTARTISSLHAFFHFLYMQGVIRENPTERLSKPKYEKRLPVVLTSMEVELLLAQPNPTTPKGCRDKAMLELLYATGLRVSELCGLNIDAVKPRRGFLICHTGGQNRMVPVGKPALYAVAEYIKTARPVLLAGRDELALFVNVGGARLSRQGFWKLVKGYKDKAGIDKDLTPHTLRHSFAAHLLENGADLGSIQEMMGFADIASTSVYTKIVENKMMNVYKKAHPRAR